MTENGRFYGKFRGVVTDVHDPLMTSRIRARVPDVMGNDESGWALPAVPFGGRGMGFFALRRSEPACGSSSSTATRTSRSGRGHVGIGCRGTAGSARAAPYQKTMIKTAAGHSITLDDTPGIGGITLETATGQKIVLNALGIEISNGLGAGIKLLGPNTSINDGALEVT